MDSLSYCFKWSVLNNGQLEFTFIFQKKGVTPLLRQKTRCHSILRINIKYQFPALSEHGISNFIPRFVGTRNIKSSFPALSEHGISMSFPALSEHGISNFNSPLCRNTKYQISFPAFSEHGISNVIPRFVGTRNINVHSPLIGIQNIKFHSPVGRITVVYSNSVFTSVIPRLSDDEMSKKVIPSVSGPEMSPIKCLFLQTISL